MNNAPVTAARSLDHLGILHGTDKSSLVGDYLRHYEALLSEWRNKEFTLLEIGVFRGGSVRTWADFFPSARIIGVDVIPECMAYARDRVTIEIGSQDDPGFLHHLAAQYSPQVIIDDGSHHADHLLFTFERLFPTLPPAGIYVIEDLHFHIIDHEAPRHRGNSEISPIEYFLDLARSLLGRNWNLRKATGFKRYLFQNIDYVHFIDQAVIIRKRPDRPSVEVLLTEVEPLVAAANDWASWMHYANRLTDHHADLTDLVRAWRESVRLNGDFIGTRERLSDVLERSGDFAGAIEALEPAVGLAQDANLRTRLKTRLASLRDAVIRR